MAMAFRRHDAINLEHFLSASSSSSSSSCAIVVGERVTGVILLSPSNPLLAKVIGIGRSLELGDNEFNEKRCLFKFLIRLN